MSIAIVLPGEHRGSDFRSTERHQAPGQPIESARCLRGVRFRLCAVAPFLGCVVFPGPSAFPQDAMQAFHKMQEALGGADKIASIHDFEETVRADAWYDDGNPIGEVRKKTRWVRLNLLRVDQIGPGDTYVLYFNGLSGWEILPEPEV